MIKLLKGCTLGIYLIILSACQSTEIEPNSRIHYIKARELANSSAQPLIYRIKAPEDWDSHSPNAADSLLDTTKFNHEFKVHDQQGDIRITIHTFPINNQSPRIPASLQLRRWKEQLTNLDSFSVHETSERWGGFSGLKLEAEGEMSNQVVKVMGWSMQLASEYVQQLQISSNPFDEYKLADFTIKVVGPVDSVNANLEKINKFAHSLELIEELPNPL